MTECARNIWRVPEVEARALDARGEVDLVRGVRSGRQPAAASRTMSIPGQRNDA